MEDLADEAEDYQDMLAEWQGDDYVLWARGKVRETRIFGENVLLTRTITSRPGGRPASINMAIEAALSR